MFGLVRLLCSARQGAEAKVLNIERFDVFGMAATDELIMVAPTHGQLIRKNARAHHALKTVSIHFNLALSKALYYHSRNITVSNQSYYLLINFHFVSFFSPFYVLFCFFCSVFFFFFVRNRVAKKITAKTPPDTAPMYFQWVFVNCIDTNRNAVNHADRNLIPK